MVVIARQHASNEALEQTPLNHLMQAIKHFRASRGILVTTGQIPSAVKQLAEQSDNVIELVDGSLLRKMVYNAYVSLN